MIKEGCKKGRKREKGDRRQEKREADWRRR
jgi:hypothetical protein